MDTLVWAIFVGAREIRACVTQLERLDPEILPASCACASMYHIVLDFVSVVGLPIIQSSLNPPKHIINQWCVRALTV